MSNLLLSTGRKRDAQDDTDPPSSRLLRLPLELRLHIFGLLLEDGQNVVISTVQAKKNPDGENGEPDRDNRQWRCGIVGLPKNQIPSIRLGYDKSLLAIPGPAAVSAASRFHVRRSASGHPPKRRRLSIGKYEAASPRRSGYKSRTEPFDRAPDLFVSSTAEDALRMPARNSLYAQAPAALGMVCRQIRSELQSNYSTVRLDNMRLYASFPYGCIIAWHMHQNQNILAAVHSIHIAGVHQPDDVPPSSHERNPRISGGIYTAPELPDGPEIFPYMPEPACAETLDAANIALSNICSVVFGQDAHPTFRRLEMRAFFPGGYSYGRIWSDRSPLAAAIRNICGGNLEVGIGRFDFGSTVQFQAEPAPQRRRTSCWWARKSDNDKVPVWEGGRWDLCPPDWGKPERQHTDRLKAKAEKDGIKWFKVLGDGLASTSSEAS